MLDRRNKGGGSIVLRCSSTVKNDTDCPFYCKLRKSHRDKFWYVCPGFYGIHACEADDIPPKFSDIATMLQFRQGGL
jgi:hypothetical protein